MYQTKSIGNYRWTICTLVFFATTINYLDRQVISLLKPYLETAGLFGNDPAHYESTYANIVIAFQLGFASGMLLLGRFIDKFGTKIGYAASLLGWSLAAIAHAFAKGPFGFGVARVALGVPEAGNYPGAIKTTAEWFPKKERALGNGVINAGSSVGATVTPLVVPLILKLVAWPLTFLFTAALDVIWFCVWLIVYRTPDKHPWLKKSELAYIRSDVNPPAGNISWLQLFRHRQTWAFLMAKGLSDPVWWFFLFWIPGFLAKQYNLASGSAAHSAEAMALPVMVIYTMASGGSVGGGWLSMRLISRGWSVNAARKTVMLGCALCVVPVFTVLYPIGLWPSVLLIGLAAAAHLGFSANLFTVATDTVPKQAVGSVAGIGGLAAAVFAMFNAKLVGFVLDKTHSYAIPFIIASSSYLVALGILHLLLPKLEPMKLEES
jgi:ACS family hexuronate transporter-like MFS transporter